MGRSSPELQLKFLHEAGARAAAEKPLVLLISLSFLEVVGKYSTLLSVNSYLVLRNYSEIDSVWYGTKGRLKYYYY